MVVSKVMGVAPVIHFRLAFSSAIRPPSAAAADFSSPTAASRSWASQMFPEKPFVNGGTPGTPHLWKPINEGSIGIND